MAKSGYSFIPSAVTRDRYLDPVTLDYVRTAEGAYVETADNRTTVLIALSTHLGKSPFDPQDGTSIEERRVSGERFDARFIEAETERVLSDLEQEGILSGLTVEGVDSLGNALLDQLGRPQTKTRWRDLGAAAPTELPYDPTR